MSTSSAESTRFDAAGARFVTFFKELEGSFVEREELLLQIALGLLSREHVLMTGPPGTAKSGVAAAVLRRVVDEKTGAPSLYARQFTESTVQTDLVGPINFKTLMESGRTEHFTDEGMLGAVHAFLDEVFDGRDMLLRATLNVLQERELKQGARTTRGQIECALMTTNRYLAEILEGARETLLAFVDRIAFVSFVPRGFASDATLASVLKRQVGGAGAHSATLTIQDLDVLQAAVDSVEVPEEVLDGLATLLGSLSEELAAAERADPQFLATRYFSTRTAVRLGRLLRAVCVYDRLFRRHDRALQVEGADLAGLRSSLVLAGPKPEALAALFAKETDARERRQLAIIRTEREIFERCLRKVGTIKVTKRRAAEAASPLAAAWNEKPAAMDTDELVAATRALVEQSTAPEVKVESDALLARAVTELGERALRAGLTSTAPAEGELDVERVARELARMAEGVEAASTGGRPMGRWLRGRALRLLEESVALASSAVGASLEALRAPPENLEGTTLWVDARFAVLERLAAHRATLRAQGADEADPKASDAIWAKARDCAEAEAADMLDLGFQKDVGAALAANPGDALEGALAALARPFSLLDAYGEKIGALGGDPLRIKALVVGPRLRPLVESAFARLQSPDRIRLVAQVDSLLVTLQNAGLREVLSARDIVAMTADALVRSARAAPAPAMSPLDRDQYRRIRLADHRVPGAFTLLEIALRVQSRKTLDLGNPEAAAQGLAELARDLPEALRAGVAEVDLGRLERVVAFFERWAASLDDVSEGTEAMLQRYAQSGFFHVIADERALLRTSLEAQLVSEVFPEVGERAERLRERLRAIEERSKARVRELLQKRSEEAWASMLRS